MYTRHRIEVCQYITMARSTQRLRARPEGCCPLRPIEPLGRARRGRLVGVFKALADPTRLEILRLVSVQSGATCVCDIVDHFELSQPTISHHLKVLRDAGLLTSVKLGIWSFHSPTGEARELLTEAESLLV